MYKRTLARQIKKISGGFPVLFVTGPRQVGKTTLLQMCAGKNRNYVTLDNMDARQTAQTDPALFLQTHKPPLIIDEVQYAPQLFSYIKIMVDEERKNGMFWLTGSQKFHLMRGLTESLAGRVAILDLLGLSQAELDDRHTDGPFLFTKKWVEKTAGTKRIPKDITEVYRQIWFGSFPKINMDGKRFIRDRFYSSYIQTYLQRDLRDLMDISNETTFYDFLTALAVRTGQLLNYADLARDVSIDNKTAKSWLNALSASGLVYLLRPYFNNRTKRLVKAPKVYFLDTGLCTYLAKWPDVRTLQSGAMAGSILETHIFSEILKSYWHNGVEPYFYYYRDTDQKEVDLLIESGDTLYPVEFKKTATPSLHASKNFKTLKKLGKTIGHGVVLCFVKEHTPLSKEVSAMPIGLL